MSLEENSQHVLNVNWREALQDRFQLGYCCSKSVRNSTVSGDGAILA